MEAAEALVAIREVAGFHWMAEQRRLNRIVDAMRVRRLPGEYKMPKTAPPDAPEVMVELARISEPNYLPLALDTYSQVLKVDGYQASTSDEMASPWADWQRNRMDARQTGLHRCTLQYGISYVLALPSKDDGPRVPVLKLFSPRRMMALYEDESDEWAAFAVYRTDKDLCLVDDTYVHHFPFPAGLKLPTGGLLTAVDSVDRAISEPHGLGYVPVVRYRDRMLLDGEEQLGIIEPLITIQERINEVSFKQQVALHTEAFKQKYVLGWLPDTEEEGLKAAASRIWHFEQKPGELEVGALPSGDPKNYSDPRTEAIRDLAAIGQIPAQTLGVDALSNISDATLAGLEVAKDRRAGEIRTSLGESHEQMFRLCGDLRGDIAAAADYESEVRWRDFGARSFAGTVDGLVKLAQAGILPTPMALEKVPGVTQQEARRAQVLAKKSAGQALVQQLIGRSSVPANVTVNAP